MGRIENTFKKLKSEGRKALIPYIMAGDPSLARTKRYINDLEQAGADIIELGVPFSDPLADGPTIQAAAERSLRGGTTLKKVLDLVEAVRKNSSIPLILMTYFNPVFKFGINKFIMKAVAKGVDGVIIPDLIPDEAGDFIPIAREQGLDTVFLLAPTSTSSRISIVSSSSSGFIYYVSVTGITGSRISINRSMKNAVSAIRSNSSLPVAVGFGISGPEEAAAISKLADGVIVGSAIVKLIARKKEIKGFVKSLRKAI